MKALVELVVRALVDNPEQVSVTEIDGDEEVTVELRVAPEDMGKVIGRQGRIIRAIRILTRAAAVRAGRRVRVEVVE